MMMSIKLIHITMMLMLIWGCTCRDCRLKALTQMLMKSSQEKSCFNLHPTPIKNLVVTCYSILPPISPHRSRRSRPGVLLSKEIKSKMKKKDGGGFCGESEGVVVITRPKGGRRSMCMDMEEVKACRELGFELEHERVLEMPPAPLSRFPSLDNTRTITSRGGNSPIANWLFSSPGDDPRDVKARLLVWAQAGARASTSMHCC